MGLKKYNQVKIIFNKISYRYDFLNTLLSFGMHKSWKRKLVNILKPIDGEDWADLCCGTGDLSFLIYKKISPNGSVTGIDNAREILKIAKKKSELIGNKVIRWETKDILEIDHNKKQYDGICISYGLRNLVNVEEGIKKIFNLLREKGRAGCLDFHHANVFSLTTLFQKIYLRLIVVPISRIFKLGYEYSYIEKSIQNYPERKKLISIAKKVGFKDVKYFTLGFNQMGILILEK